MPFIRAPTREASVIRNMEIDAHDTELGVTHAVLSPLAVTSTWPERLQAGVKSKEKREPPLLLELPAEESARTRACGEALEKVTAP